MQDWSLDKVKPLPNLASLSHALCFLHGCLYDLDKYYLLTATSNV